MAALIVQEYYLKRIFVTSLNNSLKKSLRFASHRSLPLPTVNIVGVDNDDSQSEYLKDIIKYSQDSRIRYNCVIYSHKPNLPSFIVTKIQKKIQKTNRIELYRSSVPLVLEQLMEADITGTNFNNSESVEEESSNKLSQNNSEPFPFAKFEQLHLNNTQSEDEQNDQVPFSAEQFSVRDDIAKRLKAYNENKSSAGKSPQVTKQDNDLEFRFYEDTLLSELPKEREDGDDVSEYYGTPNPDIPKSSVPCGGCGINLHCQDEGLPGYLPSEEFSGKSKRDLRAMLCQRCLFLNNHNMALNVRISPDIYEDALRPITQSKALAIVVVDLLDVPCSVWPGIFDLIGAKRPVVVVGNKVDLIPLDSMAYVETVRESLIQSIKDTNLWRSNIRHVCVVSAKTGYGIEDLVSHIQIKWGNKGDVYILGCTNAGKSSLFNALLGSDMCRVSATSLIRRATASPWPGTTLNLLKFPVMRPTGKRLFDRLYRLNKEAEAKDKETPPYLIQHYKRAPTLTGHVGQTYCQIPFVSPATEFDSFSVNVHRKPKEIKPLIGVRETDPKYVDGHWCYDTPGTVQPDQFLGLLTHDELLYVLPRVPIVSKSFSLHNSQSIFIAGLVRLDLLYSAVSPVRLTVCCSQQLPITIVSTSDASSIYRSYLGSALFEVPQGSQERLDRWPSLKPTNIRIKGIGKKSAADVVLSSAGFISIAGEADEDIDLRAWTPGGRGLYVRSISMLPFAFQLIGKKRKKTQRYHSRQVTLN